MNMTLDLNGPGVSRAGIKVTVAHRTVSVAVRVVGTVTGYRHIKQRVLVSGVGVFTEVTCGGITPPCRT
jgi:hypothetical protein